MKTKGQNNLIDEGKDNWERTDEYNKRVREISQEVSEKYIRILSAEKNWFKKLLIRIRFWREKTRKINELSSWKNLHWEMRNEE